MSNLQRIEFLKELKELTECRDLEHLLFQNYQPGMRSEEEVGKDFQELRSLTEEIKAINKQQIVLVGERLKRARDIFRNYGDAEATFTKWLDQLFTSRRTAYNILNYYEFYMELPTIELKSDLKKMPLKVAYCLSSRQAPLNEKVEIVKGYSGQSPEDTLLLIKERFPVDEKDKRRKDPNKVLLKRVQFLLETIQRRKSHFSNESIKEFQHLKQLMKALLDEI
jgi:YesN/AraC family two-component response regulator